MSNLTCMSELRQGGQAAVYLAYNKQQERQVALKIYRAVQARSFTQEVNMSQKFKDDPNFVRVFSIEERAVLYRSVSSDADFVQI